MVHLMVLQFLFYGACPIRVNSCHPCQGAWALALPRTESWTEYSAGGCLWPGEAHETGRGNYRTTQLHSRSLNACSLLCDLLVKQYDWCRRRQQPVEERCGTILDLLLFLCSTTFYHCVFMISASVDRSLFFFNLTVYLMPYLLLRFWTCLAEFAKSVYPFVFRPSVHEQKLTGH